MAADKVSTIAKPKIRGLFGGQIKFTLISAIITCTVAGIAEKILVNDSRQQVYANFYRSYDINKEFEKMRKKGLFDSC